MNLLLVGCGKMGGALLKGWRAGGLSPSCVTIVDPSACQVDLSGQRRGVRVVDSPCALGGDESIDLVLFAVKPQIIGRVVADYVAVVQGGAAVLSVVAGLPLSFFEKALGGEVAVVRAMPNTPAAVGRGMTVLCANGQVSSELRVRCGELLSAVGETAWLADESLMDAVTAVSGSGPAYVFYLVEALAAAGVRAGLSPELAMQLATATLCGAGELLRQSPETAETLRRNVTSPGGTTEAGLSVLMNKNSGLVALMADVVDAAAQRSRALSQEQ